MRNAAFVAALAILSLPALAAKTAPPPPAPAGNGAAVERGKFLVMIGSCSDCHTPMKMDEKLGLPVPDMTRYLSGHPASEPAPVTQLAGHDMAVIGGTFTSFKLPFGVAFTANLTPDATGLGSWDEKMFVRALRTGRHMGVEGGRPILPPMPWPALARLSDDDLHAIWSYLHTLKPVENRVPETTVPPPMLQKIARAYEGMASPHP
jgi:hypothetical protein